MQFIHDVIYCASARQQFAVIHNRMFNSQLTIQLVPIIFVQFTHTRVLTIIFTITCMLQYCKMGNMICTENIYTNTNKVDMQT